MTTTNPFPTTRSAPPSMPPMRSWVHGDEPRYDAKTHLQLEMPQAFTLLDPERGTLTEATQLPPVPKPGERSKLAYTAPFRFLSDAGVAALKRVLDDNMKFGKNWGERSPMTLRNMGYRSQFVRDLNTCPMANAFLSRLCGVDLVPHTYETSWGHTNVGVVGDTRAVDVWHVDSVPFVLVVMMADMAGAMGGDLEVVKKASFEEAFQRVRETDNRVPEGELLRVSYPGLGWGIFMQGSKFVHHVTPVFQAQNARVSFVNSYQSRDPL